MREADERNPESPLSLLEYRPELPADERERLLPPRHRNGLNGYHQPAAAIDFARARPRVAGKFIFAGGEKFWVRGVTYGTFRPQADGCEALYPEVVERDFALMAASGLNAVRTYTVPPRWVLDAAMRHGLRVMAGIPWEQHIAFLDDAERRRSIEMRVRAAVRSLRGHPALLFYAIGNEIPAPIARWHGARKIERFIRRLYRA
ncbi:MAG TPA: glycoside hydrolase family 2 TIM barrel-domain containing protein, partial [Candidatus Binatia bacterium]